MIDQLAAATNASMNEQRGIDFLRNGLLVETQNHIVSRPSR
jgi:hypothetical protein